MKKILVLILAIIPLLAIAKDDNKDDKTNPKYLIGAISYEEGKIVFSQSIDVPAMNKEQIYNTMLEWANERFVSKENMRSLVVYKSPEKGDIVAMAEEYIVFSSSALSLDRTRIKYNFQILAEDKHCTMKMSRIRYWYEENRDGGQKFTAEEWISDDMGLSRRKDKLAPICGKFRRETIDLKDNLFLESAERLNGRTIVVAPAVASANVSEKPQNNTARKEKVSTEIKANQLPDNISEIISAGRLCLNINDEEIEISPESWGGLGQILNKDVVYIIVEQSKMAANLLLQNGTSCEIKVYSQDDNKPYSVIKCNKPIMQETSPEDLKSLNSRLTDDKKYNLYIGEISQIIVSE